MPEIPKADHPASDIALAAHLGNRLPDGGPRYKETPHDPALYRAQLAEPYNTVTATFFILIAFFWLGRLWGRFRQHPFVTLCLPILLTGGIGGTLYHATRSDRLFFLLDVIPISVLGAAGSIFLMIRLGRSLGFARMLVYSAGLVCVYLGMNVMLFRFVTFPNPNLRVNLSYATLAMILLIPLFVVLIRTRFRHAGWVIGGLLSFGIAWFCRLIDRGDLDTLPMGTHWLWHTFGAITTFAIAQYFYLLEGMESGSCSEKPGSSPTRNPSPS
ncbi:MAG: hypothetical protein LC104_04370 [Bacteroidales bacterium]|nr:hypothetical protein [Bacteroidales bacterium]